MRRTFLLLILLVPAATCLAAGVGIGVSGGYVWGEMGTSLASPAVSSQTQATHVPLSAAVTLDADLFLARIGYSQFLMSHEAWTQTSAGTTTTLFNGDTGTAGYVSFALFGKYPFVVGGMTIAPLLGVQIDTNVLLLDTTGADLRGAMSPAQLAEQTLLWIKAGASLDVSLSERAYLRTEILVGYRLPSSAEKSAAMAAEQAGFDVTLFTIWPEVGMMAGIRL